MKTITSLDLSTVTGGYKVHPYRDAAGASSWSYMKDTFGKQGAKMLVQSGVTFQPSIVMGKPGALLLK